jgi:hypothetical protein
MVVVFVAVIGVGAATAGVAISQTGDGGSTAPPVDAQALVSQPRVGVADSHGRTRGTIPTSAWTASMKPPVDGQESDSTPVPVLDEHGAKQGYWIPTYGFVESDVVEAPGFDVNTLIHDSDVEWWNSLTDAQKQDMISKGVQPPT